MARSEPPAQRQNTFAAISQELVLHIEQLCLTLHEAEKDGIATLFEHVMHRDDSLLARVTDQTEHMRRHFALFEEVSVDFPHLFIFVLHFLLFDKFFVFTFKWSDRLLVKLHDSSCVVNTVQLV